MAKTELEKRLKGISQDELNKAQENLNRLCEEHGLNPIRLTHGKAQWRELCLRMVGLPPLEAKKAGRRSIMSAEEKERFLAYMDIVDAFDDIDDEGNEIKVDRSVQERIDLYAKKFTPENVKTQDSGKEFSGKGRLLNYWNNFSKDELKRFEEERLAIQSDPEYNEDHS